MVKVLAVAGMARCGSTSRDIFDHDMKEWPAKHQHKQLFHKVFNICKSLTGDFSLALRTPKLYTCEPGS